MPSWPTFKRNTGRVPLHMPIFCGRGLKKPVCKTRSSSRSRERHAAGLELNVLLGRESDEPIELLTGMSFTPLAGDVPGLWENARTTRPSFMIAALQKERAESVVKLAGLSRRPDFLAGFLLPSVRPNAWGVSFGLTMPFLRSGKSQGGGNGGRRGGGVRSNCV